MMPESEQFVTRKEFKEEIGGVNFKLDALSNKLDGKTQPNWAVIWSALGVGAVLIIAVAGGSWAIVNSQISSVHKNVDSFEMRMQRIENMDDKEKSAKARLWDDFVYQRVTQTP